MKKAFLTVLMALPISLTAQQNSANDPTPARTVATSVTMPVLKVRTPTAADLYCSGYLGKAIESKDRFVAGGLDSPFTTQYSGGEVIYLNGKGYEAGQEYEIVRELRDPNRYELFKGQWATLNAAGQPYEELARVKVVDTRTKMAIANIEFSCGSVLPGDFAIPYVEKASVPAHGPMRFDRFAPANGQVSGRIILAKDFDSELGDGGKVYLNIGSNQGLKVGDYLRAERTYEAMAHDPVESLSFNAAAMEPTQAAPPSTTTKFMQKSKGPEIHVEEMPRRGVGEIVILGTTPATATGMIVFSLEPVHVGDRVELDQQ